MGQTTWYVDDDAPGGPGLSWQTAFGDLQCALAVAAAGDQVRVGEGTYRPSPGVERASTFVLPADVVVAGGYAGVGAVNPDQRDPALFETILSGDLLGNDLPGFSQREDNSLHVVTFGGGGSAAVLNGCTVTAGYAAEATGFEDQVGGGILVDDAVFFMVDCTVSDNFATISGGGMFTNGDGRLVRCRFEANQSDSGAGLEWRFPAHVLVDGCTFVGNVATIDGGGLRASSDSSGRITASRFEANQAQEGGGAVVAGALDVLDSIFVGNIASGRGGGAAFRGVQLFSLLDKPAAFGCRFLGNQAAQGGGVAVTTDTAYLMSCEISGNLAATDGGGVFIDQPGRAVIDGCTVVNNQLQSPGVGSGVRAGPGGSIEAHNSVLWANGGSAETDQVFGVDLPVPPSSTNVDYSVVQGLTGPGLGDGNIAADPLLVDADGSDDLPGTEDDALGLQSGSPAIDAGNTFLVTRDEADADCDGDVLERTPLDIDGLRRRHDDPLTADTGLGPQVVDMGAHEFGSTLPTTAWTDLGGGSPGALGTPALMAGGSLCPGQRFGLSLEDAPPGALMLLWIAVSSTPVDAFGGTLHAFPFAAQFVLVADGTGAFQATSDWATGFPTQIWFQFLVADASVPGGIVLSNASRGEAP